MAKAGLAKFSSAAQEALMRGALVVVATPEDFEDAAVSEPLFACLSDEEQTRHRRFRFDRDRRLYLVAHGLKRMLLSSLLDRTPASLDFAITDRGRPELDAHTNSTQLRFNLSHTQGLVACAVSQQRTVGVDVEYLDRRVDIDALSKSVLSEKERKDLGTYRDEQRRLRFFEFWTLKEAHIKAMGQGLGLPLRDMTFLMPGPPSVGTAIMEGASGEVMPAEPYCYHCQRLGVRHQLAVAVQSTTGNDVVIEPITRNRWLFSVL